MISSYWFKHDYIFDITHTQHDWHVNYPNVFTAGTQEYKQDIKTYSHDTRVNIRVQKLLSMVKVHSCNIVWVIKQQDGVISYIF